VLSYLKKSTVFLSGLPVSPGSRATWDAQLLKIPAVSPSVMNCCVIKVEYYVKVGETSIFFNSSSIGTT
jgi:hypothetical protein